MSSSLPRHLFLGDSPRIVYCLPRRHVAGDTRLMSPGKEANVVVTWHSGISCSEYQTLKRDERDPSDLMLRDLAKNKEWKRCGHQFCY
ncbi:zinc finger, C6HC-type containing protein, partial [Tanacetum coccineum]